MIRTPVVRPVRCGGPYRDGPELTVDRSTPRRFFEFCPSIRAEAVCRSYLARSGPRSRRNDHGSLRMTFRGRHHRLVRHSAPGPRNSARAVSMKRPDRAVSFRFRRSALGFHREQETRSWFAGLHQPEVPALRLRSVQGCRGALVWPFQRHRYRYSRRHKLEKSQ
jgi:hypothetical protein